MAMTILSFGGGLQSTTLHKMIICGEHPRPDHYIFADTGAETEGTYANVNQCEAECVRAGIPFHRVSSGDMLADLQSEQGRRFASPPLFTRDLDTGKTGILRRQCTSEYKIEPINRKVRELFGVAPRVRLPTLAVDMWLCITTDELQRVTVSRERWKQHVYPLVDLRMHRRDCTAWLQNRGMAEPPRSACVFCPFRSDTEWRHVKSDPVAWKTAIAIDEALRTDPKTRSERFVYKKAVPLAMADLSTPEEQGQGAFRFECAGVCGI